MGWFGWFSATAGLSSKPRFAAAQGFSQRRKGRILANLTGQRTGFCPFIFAVSRFRSGFSLLWLACLIGVRPYANAFQAVPYSLKELAAQAGLVVQGKVIAKSCQRDAERRIYTKVELAVSEVWKGAITNRTMTIVQGGGVLGERRVVVPGQAEYQPGEEVVVFLTRNDRGEGVTLALAQGKFTVWTDPTNGQQFTFNPFHGSPPPSTSGPVSQHDALLALQTLKRVTEGANR